MIYQSIIYFPLCQKWASKNATKTKQKRQAVCAKEAAISRCASTLNSSLCVWKGLWSIRVHAFFDRFLLSLMSIFECILSCYGQCKVVKCCLCTVCLMSHIFMYSNIHTQCIIHLLLQQQYLSSFPVCVY